MKNLVRSCLVAGVLAMSGTAMATGAAAEVPADVSAAKAPCGYYIKNGYGYIRNCYSYRAKGFYQQRGPISYICIKPGGTAGGWPDRTIRQAGMTSKKC